MVHRQLGDLGATLHVEVKLQEELITIRVESAFPFANTIASFEIQMICHNRRASQTSLIRHGQR